jgi:hypothetical protein
VRPPYIRRFLPVLLLAFGTTLSSCWGRVCDDCNAEYTVAEAYVPVYGYDSAKYMVKPMPAQPIKVAGKIYVWGKLLFQVEQHQGIHVIDYTDKQNPVKLGFIGLKGCTEIAVKGNYLIANNMIDLVTIDISQPAQAKEVSRMKGAFSHLLTNREYEQPGVAGVYYECPDRSKGDVIGWKVEKNVKGYWCHN